MKGYGQIYHQYIYDAPIMPRTHRHLTSDSSDYKTFRTWYIVQKGSF